MKTQLHDPLVTAAGGPPPTHRFLLACAVTSVLMAGAVYWILAAPDAWNPQRSSFHLLVLVPSLIAISLTWPARKHGGADGLTARMWRSLTLAFGTLFAAHAFHLAAVLIGGSVVLTVAGSAFHLVFFLVLLSAFSSFEQVRVAARRHSGRVRALVQHACDAIAVVAPDSTIGYQSPSSLRLLGVTPEALLGTLYLDRVHPEDRERFFTCLAQALKDPEVPTIGEWRLRHERDAWLHFETYVTNRLSDPAIEGIVLNSRDVTERKVLEEELKFRAFHDSLTGLANRALFTDRVEQALVRTRRSRRGAALLFMDLDNFKMVNDLLGHAEGDRLLVEVASRLRRCIRATDTVARFGGDEFAILLEDMAHPADAALVAERVIRDLTIPMRSNGRDIVVSTSIGVAPVGGTETCDELMHHADSVMYLAKKHGRGRYEIFDAALHGEVARRREIEADFRRALDMNEMVVHYRPMVGVESHRIEAVEAVIRWHHPKRGLLEVDQFLDIAQETAQLSALGDWLVETVCRQLRAWHLLYPGSAPLAVTIPLFTEQLEDDLLVERVRYALQRTAIHPDTVVFEVTGGMVIGDPERSTRQLLALKELGVRVGLATRGSDSAAAEFRRLPIDVLRVLPVGGTETDGSQPWSEAVVGSARPAGGTRAVAGGVQTAEQADELQRLGFDLAQGPYFADPMRKEVLEILLQGGAALASPVAAASGV